MPATLSVTTKGYSLKFMGNGPLTAVPTESLLLGYNYIYISMDRCDLRAINTPEMLLLPSSSSLIEVWQLGATHTTASVLEHCRETARASISRKPIHTLHVTASMHMYKPSVDRVVAKHTASVIKKTMDISPAAIRRRITVVSPPRTG